MVNDGVSSSHLYSLSPPRPFDLVFAAFDDPLFSTLINIATVEAAKAKGTHSCEPLILSRFGVWPQPETWTFPSFVR